MILGVDFQGKRCVKRDWKGVLRSVWQVKLCCFCRALVLLGEEESTGKFLESCGVVVVGREGRASQ